MRVTSKKNISGHYLLIGCVLAFYGGLYILSASKYVFPGESARYASRAMGYDVLGRRVNLVWQALAEGLLSILPGSPVVWLSASSITTGLICLGLIAWFNALSCPRHDRHARVGPSVTQYGLYSGILAMCFLGTFPSFWAAATRPGPWMFDAALFLGIGVIVGRNQHKRIDTPLRCQAGNGCERFLCLAFHHRTI